MLPGQGGDGLEVPQGVRPHLPAHLLEPGAHTVARITGRGENQTERILPLVLLGDLVSVYLAVLHGTDPTPIDVLDRFKAALG